MPHPASHLYEPLGHEEPAPWHQPALFPLVFDRDGVRAIDRLAVEQYGIPGMVLMENAARGLCESALEMHRRSATLVSPSEGSIGSVVILCGSGNNGGDGYALARHLHNHGVDVSITALGEPSADSDAGRNREICKRMQLREISFDQLVRNVHPDHISLIVDAIFGTGLDRPVSGIAAKAIEWINQIKRPVLAADVPSGMDCDSGEPLGGAVHATRTVTFVGLKKGFMGLDAQSLLGEVIVADIGAPVELLERFGTRIEVSHRDAPEHSER